MDILLVSIKQDLKQVIPGDVLTMKVTLTKEKGGIYFAAIEAKVEDQIAVVGEIMCAVGD